MKTIITALFATLAMASLAGKPVPTILSTDIGGDIDDTWALAHLVRSPELDLKMVMTETGEAEYRALVAAKYLEVTGNTDVQIAIGPSQGEMGDEERHQGPWVEDYKLSDYPGPVHEDGIQAFINLVESTDGPINVIAVGPAPGLAAAVTRAPEIARKCRFFGMYGSFALGYGGVPEPANEYNVRADVDAFRTLMAAEWESIALTPLDTCGLVVLEGENYHKIWCATGDPVTRAVIENYCIWAPRVPWMDASFFTRQSSTLFDNVAIYMAYADDLIVYEDVTFSVTNAGYTVRDPSKVLNEEGPFTARVAMAWKDLPAFKNHLTQRLLGKD